MLLNTLRARKAPVSHLLSGCGFLLFGWLLIQKIGTLDLPQIGRSFVSLPPWGWVSATLFTAASFYALGRYDALAHRLLRTGTLPSNAVRSGQCAIAISQFVGFGIFSGALVRWRCLPNLSFASAMRISAFVSLSFLAALAIVMMGVVALSDPLPNIVIPKHFLVMISILCFALLSVWATKFRFSPLYKIGRSGALRFVFWTTIDTGFAALALACLLPTGALTSHETLFAVYLIALAAGLLSNSPGGIGAFDLTFLALAPIASQEAALAGLCAFRLVYFLFPAVCALLFLARPFKEVPCPSLVPVRRSDLELALSQGAPAEWGLVRQGARIARSVDRSGWLFRDILGHRVGIGPAYRTKDPSEFREMAQSADKIPLLYKTDRATALRAKECGWAVARIARDAFLYPSEFNTIGPGKRQLRRKLRHADRAGVRVIQSLKPLPIRQMLAVAKEWEKTNRRERGFSMGRFDPDYLTQQTVFLAHREGSLLAFVSFHRGRSEWTLDLMRHRTDIPDGTMHALLIAAIAAARSSDISNLNLSSVPDADMLFGAVLVKKSEGLRRFKASFDPDWRPRYAAAPTKLNLLFGLFFVSLAIHFPKLLASGKG